jgi:PKD repeat protein
MRIDSTGRTIIMRTFKLTLVAAMATTTIAACTVSDVDAPAMSGPSSFARTIIMQADRDTLVQDGVQEAAIRITAQVQPGQSENVRLRAQIFVDGVAQDFGTLSNKNPITPTTIFYRAPAAPANAGGQVPTRVTISVTPDDQGDFRSEVSREVDLMLIPPGVILPTNPNLAANFTFTPAAPLVLDTVTFDATTTTNSGAACLTACTFAWNFGDGTTGTGVTTTHQFRRVGNFAVNLTVTDNRGASASSVKVVPVAQGTPPTAIFTTSPSNPGVNQTVFFNASQSVPAAGRTIASYDWTFGDGSTGTGSVTSHAYSAAGIYVVQLTTTDDAGSVGRSAPFNLTVGTSSGPNPVAALTCSPGDASESRPVSCNASASTPGSGSNIESYTFQWGDGSPPEVQTNPVQSHLYPNAGTFQVTLTVRDTLGRTHSTQVSVTVSQ